MSNLIFMKPKFTKAPREHKTQTSFLQDRWIDKLPKMEQCSQSYLLDKFNIKAERAKVQWMLSDAQTCKNSTILNNRLRTSCVDQEETHLMAAPNLAFMKDKIQSIGDSQQTKSSLHIKRHSLNIVETSTNKINHQSDHRQAAAELPLKIETLLKMQRRISQQIKKLDLNSRHP